MNAKEQGPSLSFGRYLQAIRLEKGISLQDVSKETRIRIDNLLFIEREDHEHLPAQIFVKGFLRAYAKAIGADDNEAVRRYEKRYKTYQKVLQSEVVLTQLRTGVWANLRIVSAIIFCLIILSVYVLSMIHKRHVDESINAQVHQTKMNLGDQGVDSGSDGISSIVDGDRTENSKLLLKVTTVKDTWMKVIVDGQSPEKFSLSTGDRLEFEAFSGFNLLIGDATGVQLLLNDKPYEITGDNSQAVTIQIP